MRIENISLFEEKSILDQIERQLRRQGYAGKTDIPKIVFLAAHTRHQKNPVSLVVMGPSGSGKTYGIESGLQFIPKEAVESLSGMSEKALAYYSGPPLTNRVLYIGEASGMASGDGRTFLRQLLSEGKVEYLTVQKTTSGLKGEKLDTVEGPVAFMMATTANSIHPEDQSRLLVLNVDEDLNRVRELLLNQSKGLTKQSMGIDTKPWFEIDKLVADHKAGVSIPYATKLASLVHAKNIKISRDFPKVLRMIEACALVHQCTRDKGEDGAVIASEQDYIDIYGLLNGPLSHGLETGVREGVATIVKAVEKSEQSGRSERGLSQSKIAGLTGIERSVVSRNVQAAIEQGYLINMNPGQGREASVIKGDRPLPSGDILPSPDRLFGAPAAVTKDLPKRVPWLIV